MGTYYYLLTTTYLLLPTYDYLLTTTYLLLTPYNLLLTPYSLLPTPYSLLPTRTCKKIISDPFTTHLPRHQISPQNLTLPPDLMNTITEMFINKDTLPIFHPGTYKLNTLGIIGICLIIVLIIGIFTGIKICCCPQMDITQLCCKWKKTQPSSTPKQQGKARKTQPKQTEMRTMIRH